MSGTGAVGVVGLGAMGSRVAVRLLDSGRAVVVWNRSPGPMRVLEERGATPVATPAAAAAAVTELVILVADAAALQAVTEGESGVSRGAHEGLTVLQMSTVGPAATIRLARTLPPRTALLDAPVLGSVHEAETGRLTVLAAGSTDVAERSRSLLETLGMVLHVGDIGAGQAAKLVANSALLATVASLGETLALADALGLSRPTSYDVLALTPLAAQAERRRPAIDARNYPPRFPVALARKDAELSVAAARTAGRELRVMTATRDWLADAEACGCSRLDYTSMLDVIAPVAQTRRTVAPSIDTSGGGYDGLIVDIDGVVLVGDEPVPGAIEVLQTMRRAGVRLVYVTNDPQFSNAEHLRRLTRAGVDVTADRVVTATATTAVFLARAHAPHGRILAIGSQGLYEDLDAAGLHRVSPDETDHAHAVVVAAHRDLHYSDLCAATRAIRAGATLYAPGRDLVFPTPAGPAPATGAILAAVEAATGVRATVIGKPEPFLFELARESLGGCSRVAVVGDNLAADIVGAKRAGLQAILVLTGVTSSAEAAAALIRPDHVVPRLSDVAVLCSAVS